MIFPAASHALQASLCRWRALVLLPGLVAAALATPFPSEAANSHVCRQLEAELASAGRYGASTRAQRYDAAIDRQREQMAIARRQARDAGCGYALSGATVRQCAAINATLDRMVRNLDTLERNRARLARPEQKRSRSAVLAALDANGCRETPQIEAAPLRDMLTTFDEAAPTDGGGPFDADAPPGERFRTLCVRSCDGYFYPMSNGATVTEFERDTRNCETSCPGTDMQIFYGPQGSEDVGAMRSTRTGEPYSTMPTAFMHQNVALPRPAQCGCGLTKDYAIIAGTPPAHAEEPAGPESGGAAIPVPGTTDTEDGAAEAAIAPAEPAVPAKPSSIIFVPPPKGATEPPPAPEISGPMEAPMPEAAPDRAVRVVGPEFLPDPAGAIDLRTKDPNSAP